MVCRTRARNGNGRRRTYWFFEGDVIYPFGYGLSYTTFEYQNFNVDRKIVSVNGENKIKVSVDIKNTGKMKGDEVVQLYIKDLESSVIQPLKRLRKFQRITLEKGETKTMTFALSNEDFSYWDKNKKDWTIEPGEFEIQVGASLRDIKLKERISAN
jgi:beta-glucosidase